MKYFKTILALLLIAVLVAGCTAKTKDTETATPEPTEAETPEPTEKATPHPLKSKGDGTFSGTVYIVGDSIAALHDDKEDYERPLYGWGEIIPEYYTDQVTFVNKAVSSQSTKSYYEKTKASYNAVYDNLAENDYVIISFGHNDHNTDGGNDRVTDPDQGSDVEGSFKYYLKNFYIDPALEKGALPILMSSVVRCFYNDGVFEEEDIHLKYGQAMRDLVEEYAAEGITIYMIDAQEYTYDLYSKMGEDEAMLYHGLGDPSWEEWYKDTTHYSEAGARMICDFIVSELGKLPLELNNYRK